MQISNQMSKSKNVDPEESLMTGVISQAFKGVKKSWRKIFLSSEIKPILSKCFSKLDKTLLRKGVTRELLEQEGLAHFMRPAPADIFAAFRYFEFPETKVIIIGQDPYVQKEQAQGLSFSVPKGIPTPRSLKTIYGCLKKQGLIKSVPKHGNLEGWAKQGVLLLNRYLTRNPTIEYDDVNMAYVKSNGGTSKHNLHPFWAEFTDAVVKYIAEHHKKYYCLLLWGTKAQEITGALADYVIRDEIDIQQWGHPSPASTYNQTPNPKNFENCDHFEYVNEQLRENGRREINWDCFSSSKKSKVIAKPPVQNTQNTRIVVYTDGGCTKNGKQGANATYGVYFPQSFQGVANCNICNLKINGRVSLYEQELKDLEITDHTNGKTINPSNNRGELLAIIYALRAILQEYGKHGKRASILIITDSEYCMHMINERIWKWYRANKNFTHKANSDLVLILWKLLQKLKPTVLSKELLQPAAESHYRKKTPMDLNWQGLTVLHQRGHRQPPSDKTSDEYEIWAGNDVADKLCNDAYEYKNFETHED